MFPLISEKAVEEAVRNCEQLKRREQEEDNVTIEELEKQRVEALEVVEKEREDCGAGESCVPDSIQLSEQTICEEGWYLTHDSSLSYEPAHLP